MKAAGADVLQIDEPYLQPNPEEAERYGVAAIDAALEGIEGPTVVHLCFGYAHSVKDKPAGYSYLPQLDACRADAISIEAAQPRLDPAVLRRLPNKKVLYGVLDLGDPAVEAPETVAERIRGALKPTDAERLTRSQRRRGGKEWGS